VTAFCKPFSITTRTVVSAVSRSGMAAREYRVTGKDGTPVLFLAQEKVEQLGNKLKVQTQQMTELQSQIVSIRSVLEQLQQKLE